MTKKLILVNGAPASGKTTLIDWLRKETDIVIIEKDAIKEFFFDYVGYEDREWSKALGKAAVDAMFALVVQMFKIKDALILENAFYQDLSRQDIKKIQAGVGVKTLEIYCEVEEAVRRKRFAQRANDIRHPGHADLLSPDEASDNLDRYRSLDIGQAIHVDMKEFQPDVQGRQILAQIKQFIEKEQG